MHIRSEIFKKKILVFEYKDLKFSTASSCSGPTWARTRDHLIMSQVL